ncbi:MAG: NAD kinase [Muribaculaceae bacterium]|nr:NAD kinase [Muribaculaceae bacterium]
MRIVIYGNKYQEAHIDDLVRLFATLSKYNTWLEIERSFYEYLCEILPQKPAVNDIIGYNDDFSAAIALSIGGDGTFLRTAQRVSIKGIPILGINTGHLGYLADVSVDDIEDVVDDLINDRYKIECRSMLEVSCNCGCEIEHPYALNEVAILKQDTSSMISMATEIDNEPLTTYLGDGLIVATPTGSTAYNLSVGGPILEPTSKSFALSPIAAHSITMRPLVINNDRIVKVTTASRAKSYRLSLDGRSFTLPQGSSVVISKAQFSVKVIQRMKHNFSSTLRSKLMWGIDKR